MVNIWMWKAERQADMEVAFQDMEAVYPRLGIDSYPNLTLAGVEQPGRHALTIQSDPTFVTGWGAGNIVSDPTRRGAVEDLHAQGFGTLLRAFPKVDQKVRCARRLARQYTYRVLFRRSLAPTAKGSRNVFSAGSQAAGRVRRVGRERRRPRRQEVGHHLAEPVASVERGVRQMSDHNRLRGLGMKRRDFLRWCAIGGGSVAINAGYPVPAARRPQTRSRIRSRALRLSGLGEDLSRPVRLRPQVRLGVLAQRHACVPGARLRPEQRRHPSRLHLRLPDLCRSVRQSRPRSTGTRASAPRATPSIASSTGRIGCDIRSCARDGRRRTARTPRHRSAPGG